MKWLDYTVAGLMVLAVGVATGAAIQAHLSTNQPTGGKGCLLSTKSCSQQFHRNMSLPTPKTAQVVTT